MNRIGEDVGKVRMYFGPGFMYTINTITLFCGGYCLYAKYEFKTYPLFYFAIAYSFGFGILLLVKLCTAEAP